MMRIKNVCVLGGSGFVGSSIVERLDEAGYQVKVLTRRRDRAKHLFLLPKVQVVECDVMDNAALAREISGSDAVINLIGILHESSKSSFDTIHHQLPSRLVHICREQGVSRLLHMSALQAAKDAPSAYLCSKGEGEAAVMAAKSEQFHVSVFRPSVIFGRGDSFVNLFASLVKLLPVVPLAKPAARFQPVFVEDVAQAFVASLENIDTYGQRYDLCGPQVYSLRELVQYVAGTLGLKRRIIGLNDRLSYLQAYMMELLPIKLMTRDNLKSMEVDSVCGCPFPPIFGLQPTAMEAVVPDYLRDDTPRYAYKRFRGAVGR
jgi:NADH dehydrogenase